jgi:2-phospho-L-lactate guanylyltransferase
MTLAAVVPVKGLAAGKGRLAAVLSDAERASFNRRLLERTLGSLATVARVRTIIVVSPDDEALAVATAGGAVALRETAPGLNAALAQAVEVAAKLGAAEILIVSVDLPFLEAADLEAMVPGHGVAIAPDRRGTGTNALYLSRPGLIDFAYGERSFAAHVAAAAAAGTPAAIVRRPGLAFDVDTPDDYREWLTLRGAAR